VHLVEISQSELLIAVAGGLLGKVTILKHFAAVVGWRTDQIKDVSELGSIYSLGKVLLSTP
jgi:hypothetical protein